MSNIYTYKNTNFTKLKKINHIKNFTPLKLKLNIKIILSTNTYPKYLLIPKKKFKLIK